MSPARAHPAGQVLHRTADPPAPVSANTIDSYRDSLRLRLGQCPAPPGKPPAALDWDDLDRTDRRLLGPPRSRPSQRPDAQPATDRDPVPVPLRAPRHPEHARLSAGCWPSPPSDSTSPDQLPHRAGGRRPDRRPCRVRWEPPDRALCAGGPDRAASLRAHRPELRRHHPRHRRSRLMHRQGTQATGRPADQAHPGRAPGLDGRAGRRPGRPAVPDPDRQAAQPRRRRRLITTRRHRSGDCPTLPGRNSTRTCSATPVPWTCSGREWTPPSSPCGSATPTSAPPTPTSTPT